MNFDSDDILMHCKMSFYYYFYTENKGEEEHYRDAVLNQGSE